MAPILKVVQGEQAGQSFPLDGDRTTVGRHPQCDVVLENVAVSRQHARFVRAGADVFVEDMSSRNGTFLNDVVIEGQAALKDNDRIQLSDVILTFHTSRESAAKSDSESFEVRTTPLEPDSAIEHSQMFPAGSQPFMGDNSSIVSSIEIRSSMDGGSSAGGGHDLTAAKLEAVLEISRSVSRVLELDKLFPRILETLFKTFPQTEQGFVLLLDPQTQRLKVKASQTRHNEQADMVAVSMTVVRRAMQGAEAIISANVPEDSRFTGSTSLSQLRIRSIMCAPLLTQDGRAIGVIQIDTRDAKREFAESDLELLVAVASQSSIVVENAQLQEERLAQRAMERDLEFATQVQRGFLPNERPRVEGYSFSDFYEAARSVGGDYYDYVPLPGGRWAVLLGDVAGKGVSAALLMARLYASARFAFLTEGTVAEAVTALNQDIVSSGMGQKFVTFVAMVLDPKAGTLTLANAGHMPPMMREAGGAVVPISKAVSSLPLGIMPDTKYTEETIDFPAGSSVLAFTDGITEALNQDREMYGRDRLRACFASAEGDITEVVRAVTADARQFSQGTRERDDTCLVALSHRD